MNQFPVSLDGRKYLVDLSFGPGHPYSYRRESVATIRDQQDTSELAGEVSISRDDLWRRSQETWEGGSGQSVLDRAGSEITRFRTSKGIDPWDRWRLQLLKETIQKAVQTNTNPFLLVAGSFLYRSEGTNISHTQDITATPPVWVTALVGGTTVTSMATDGKRIYASRGVSALWNTERGTGSGSTFWTSPTGGTVTLVGYVMGRLLAAVGFRLYNVTGGATQVELTPANFNDDWTWTAFGEGPGSIYAAGFAGDKSKIFRVSITPEGTNLGPPVVAGEVPDGEIVRSIQSYLGVVMIGTDKGLRLALSESGFLVIGPLIPTPKPVLTFEPQDRFIWFGWCLPGDQLVAREDGTPAPIADVRVGDHVLTRAGRARKVLNHWVRPYDGEMVSLNIRGYPWPIRLTPNHELPTSDGWKRAGDVAKGDILLRPRPQMEDGGDYLSGWLVGLFLAEGHVDNRPPDKNERCAVGDCDRNVRRRGWCVGHLRRWERHGDVRADQPLSHTNGGRRSTRRPRSRVVFSIAAKEVEHVVGRLREWIAVRGLERHHHLSTLDPQVVVRGNGAQVALSHPDLRALVDEWVTHQEDERRPAWSKRLTRLPLLHEFARGIWDGWFFGDGCAAHKVGVTVSRDLAHQMQLLGGALGTPTPLWRNKGGYRGGLGKTGKTSPLFTLGTRPPREGHGTQCRVLPEAIGHPVVSVQREHYAGEVHDLEVDEDHTFLAGPVAVSNSNFDAVSTGLGRADLLTFTQPLTPAFASDLLASTQGEVQSVVTFQDRRVFSVKASGIWIEGTNKVASGTLDSGRITYGLPDKKVAMAADLRHEPLDGTVQLQLAADGGSFSTVVDSQTAGSRTAGVQVLSPTVAADEAVEARLILNRKAGDNTLGPVVTRYTVFSQPTPRQAEIVTLPLILHRRVTTSDGEEVHLDPRAEFNALKTMERNGDPVDYIEGSQAAVKAVVDSVSFVAHKASEDWFEGDAIVVLKVFV